MISLDRALEQLLAQATALGQTETVANRRWARTRAGRAIISSVAVPPLDNSEMDGYAVRCADLASVPASLPVSQRSRRGGWASRWPRFAARIFTGAPIPSGM